MSVSKTAPYYIQPTDIPEREPPLASQGIIAWARANLFGSVTDTIITVLLAVILLWASWNAISSFVLRANVEGVTQGEGTMARVIAELDAELDEADRMISLSDSEVAELIVEQQRDLDELGRRIRITNLAELPTETRLGLQRRILPIAIQDRFTIAQSKLPLSSVVELEILKRNLMDPRVTEISDFSALELGDQEIETLKRESAPWTRGTEESKVLFQETLVAARRIINKAVKVDQGKVYADLAEVRVELNELFEQSGISPAEILERPTRPALQFNGVVDGVIGTIITTIPVSRLQKIRKDSLTPDQIRQLRIDLAAEIVMRDDPNATGLRKRKALENAESSLTDAVLFLSAEMPGGYADPIPISLLSVLESVDFWDVAMVLAEPDKIIGTEEDATETQTNSGPLDPNSATTSEGLTTHAKVPLVVAAMDVDGSHQAGAYADAVIAISAAYTNRDINGMRVALGSIEPLTRWARSNNGSNWAIIKQNFWPRMMVGTYPPDKLWRVAVVLVGLFVAVAPLFVPSCRQRAFYMFAGVYPLFLLFFLSGLAIRFYGFHGAEEGAGLFGQLYSEQGRVMQAGIMLLLIALAWFVRTRTPIGKTAGPALIVSQVLALGYFIIMIWGTIINPGAAEKNILVEENFVGLLTSSHPLGDELNPDLIQAQIDDLNAQADAEGLSRADALALRTRANELKPSLAAMNSARQNFLNVVNEGEGTFVILPHTRSLEWGGLLVTMVLGVVGMAASLPIGIVLAFGRQSTLPIVRWFSTGLIEVIRGVPLIALLLVVTFVLPKLLPAGTDYPKLGLVLIAICLFGGVYQAEVIRGGLQSLPKGQYEAAQSIGLTFWQESRLITLPQALKAVIPAIVNTFIGLFKDTTLVIVVGIVDLLTIVEYQITAENAWNTTKPEALIVVSLIFFVLMFSLSRYSIWLEKRLATGHR